MHIVLLSLAVAQLAAARQYFQHPAEVRVAPAEYPSNTAHGVWKPQRSPWLNDSPPPERNRRVGRRDFSDLEPVAESSIEMKVESQELLTSSENVKGGTKRIVKHITSLEPSGYNGGNEGNNLEAWQSVNSDHGGVFPDGYDGLSAMPRTLINEVVSSSGNPLPIPPPPPPRNYPQFPPPPSRRHIIDMNPPGFVPPDMSASSPLSGDFGGEEFLDRSGRDSGDAGGPLTTTPATTTPFDKGEEGAEAAGSDPFDTNLDDISETTPDTVEEVTTQSTTESTTTASTTTTTTTTEEPDTTPSVVEDLPVEVGQAIEQEQAVAVFTMKSPVAPPIFENSVTALFEEPDDDSLEDPVIIKKSTLPNVNQSKPSITTPASVAPSESTSTSSQSPAPIVVTAGTSSTTKEHGNEEGPYEPLNPPQPAETGNAEATSAPAPQPVPSGPIEHNYGIPSSGPAPAAPQVPEPVPTAAPQPAEHTYGAQGPDIAPIPTAAPYSPPEVPQAPINPGPAPVNPSQSIAVAPEPIGNTNIESAEHIDAKPSYPGQSSYSNLEEDHEDGNVAELPGPGPAPERTPAPSVPGESNFGNLEEDHEDYHPVEGSKSGPAPVPVVQTSGGSSYSNLEEDNEPSTGTSGSSYRGNHHSTESENENEKESESETDTDSESETDSETETTTETHGKSDEEQEYDNEAQHTAGETDDSGESISNIDKEPVPQVVVPTRTGGGYRTGGTIESTAPEPKGYQRPQPIRVQVNPATVPYRPRPSPAPRIQPPRPYNPQPIPIPQPQPQPQPYVQRPSLHLPYQPQQPRYPQPVPFQPRPAPFVPSFQPLPQRPSPSGCCGGQLFSQQGGLCMPISFNPCQQQSNCGGGGGCGGGCGGGGNSCGGGCGGGGSSCGGGCGSSCGGGGGGCGGGCGGGGGGCSPSCCQPQTSACCNQAVSTCCQPQQMPCCNQQVQTCCPPPVQRSCCCPPPSSICRHKRSLGYAMGICQRRRA